MCKGAEVYLVSVRVAAEVHYTGVVLWWGMHPTGCIMAGVGVKGLRVVGNS